MPSSSINTVSRSLSIAAAPLSYSSSSLVKTIIQSAINLSTGVVFQHQLLSNQWSAQVSLHPPLEPLLQYSS